MVTKRKAAPSPLQPPDRPLLALGLEGSANKLGVGLILHSPPAHSPTTARKSPTGDSATVSILSNIRHTYVTPPGEGFLPSDTARHHKRWISQVVAKALEQASKSMHDVDVVCFTKGPGMGAPLQTVALVARTLALMYNKPLVGVNHCVGRASHLSLWLSLSCAPLADSPHAQTSRRAASSRRRRRPSSCTSRAATPRSLPTRSSATASSARRSTSPSATASTGASPSRPPSCP